MSMAAEEEIDSLLEEGIRNASSSVKKDIDSSSGDERIQRNGRSKERRSRSSGFRGHSSRRSRRHRTHRRNRSESRSRSGSGSRYSRKRSQSKDRYRSSRRRRRHRSYRSGSRSNSTSRKKSSRSKSVPDEPKVVKRSTSAERAEKAKERELMELTRDHRTVFVGQLTQKVREKDLEKYFNRIGKTEHVLLIRDKFTNRSKGFAYVEMSNLEDVPKVLLLNGQVPDFQIFPIMIKASEAEKNFAAKKDTMMTSMRTSDFLSSGDQSSSGAALAAAIASTIGVGGSGGSFSAASRIYCGNLHTNVTEDHLRVVFSSFGEVVSVNINRDEMGRSKGYGFIQFNAPQEANLALSKGNGLELHGSFLRLGPVNEHAGLGGGNASGSALDGGNAWKLDDDEGAGMALNSQSRTALMAKLAGGKDIFPNPALGSTMYATGLGHGGSVTTSESNTAQIAERAAALASEKIEGTESFCFVVKNMFDVQTEKKSGNPDWHSEIQQDVVEECESFGPVLHSFVEKEKVGGLVYILFENIKHAVAAANKMHGRWFNKRQISVRYLSSQEYVGMFPEARSAVQTARESS